MVWTRQQAFSIARLDCYSSRTRVEDDSSKSTKSGDQHINVPGPYLVLNYHATTAQSLGHLKPSKFFFSRLKHLKTIGMFGR